MDHKMQIYGQNNLMGNFVKSDDILSDMRGIIETSRESAYQAVNVALLQRNWLLLKLRLLKKLQEKPPKKNSAATGVPNTAWRSLKSCRRNLWQNTAGALQNQTYIISILSIKHTQTFSKQRLENLPCCFRGVITLHYCRWKTIRQESGMPKKPLNKHGQSAPCREISARSIITACFPLRTNNRSRTKWQSWRENIKGINWNIWKIRSLRNFSVCPPILIWPKPSLVSSVGFAFGVFADLVLGFILSFVFSAYIAEVKQ